MGSVARKLPALMLIAASVALGGCENQALMQWFDTKPKLQGNRVPVFPEGVPGVQQGVPPELMKGYQSQVDQQTQQAQAQGAAEQAEKAAEEERKRAQAERRKTQQPSQQASQSPSPPRQPSQPRAQRKPAPQPEQAAAEPASPPQQQRPTSAPLADRWPSAQQEPPATTAATTAAIGDDTVLARFRAAVQPAERSLQPLEHDPEKWDPVFGKIMLKQKARP